MPTMDQYLPIVLLLVVGIAFAAGSFVASRTLGPSRPTGAKDGPYESGIASEGGDSVRFPVRFFMVAMIFIIFDIEVVFLYPWAVVYHQLDKFGLAEMATFAVVVFVSFAYLVSNGALDWGPGRRFGRSAHDPARTTTSTVRRVSRPGQPPQPDRRAVHAAGSAAEPVGTAAPSSSGSSSSDESADSEAVSAD